MDALSRHMPRLRWQLMQCRQRLGFWGLLALGMMAAALLIDVAVIRPALISDQQRRQELEAGIAEQPQEVQVTEPVAVEKMPGAEDFAPRLEKLLGLLAAHVTYLCFERAQAELLLQRQFCWLVHDA